MDGYYTPMPNTRVWYAQVVENTDARIEPVGWSTRVNHSIDETVCVSVYLGVSECMRACISACVCLCECMRVTVCVYVCECVRTWEVSRAPVPPGGSNGGVSNSGRWQLPWMASALMV